MSGATIIQKSTKGLAWTNALAYVYVQRESGRVAGKGRSARWRMIMTVTTATIDAAHWMLSFERQTEMFADRHIKSQRP